MSPEMSSQTPFCSECGRPTPPDELARFGDRLVCLNCKDVYTQKLREGVPTAQLAPTFGGFWIRFVAVVIDGIVLAVVQWILSALFLGRYIVSPQITPGMRPDEVWGPLLGAIGVSWTVGLIVGCTYETFFIARFGATPGKMVFGLRVIAAGGGRVGVPRAIGRYFAKILSSIILLIGYIIAAFDSQKRALHDMICDTRVIRIKG